MEILAFPVNALILLLLFDCIVIFHIWKHDSAVVRFFESVKAAIIAIVLLLVIVVVLGIVLRMGNIQSITHTWPFVISAFIFLIVLGFAAVKRTIPFNRKSIWFIITHWGLWLAFASLFLGSFDRKSCDVVVSKDSRYDVAQVSEIENVQLPFVMSCSDFHCNSQKNELVSVSADVEFFWNDEDYDFYTIRVNEPYSKNGWLVSLKSFSQENTRIICVFSVLYDSWKFFVEFGLALLAVGSIMMLVTRRRKFDN